MGEVPIVYTGSDDLTVSHAEWQHNSDQKALTM